MDRIQLLKKAIQIEFKESKDRYSGLNGLNNIKDKVKEGSAIYPLILQKHSYSVQENPILFLSKDVNQENPFKNGDLIQLIGESEKENAVLINSEKGQIEITLNTEDIPDWVFEADKMAISKTVDDRTFKEMDKALNSLESKENEKTRKIYKEIFSGQSQTLRNEIQNFKSEQLNPSQNKAVENIINSESVALVHGPPGTGKTTTLVETVKELVHRKNKVLITAPSNAAVDHFFNRIKDLNALRIGRINNTLDQKIQDSSDYKLIKNLKKQADDARAKAGKWKRSFSAEDRQERSRLYKEAREIRKEIKQLQKHIETKFIEKADVICTTLIGSANDLIKNIQFDYVFIDEAGQSLEPACWVAANKGDHLVLCGDHQQLPPTILSKGAKKDLEISLLESASKSISNISFLDTQYRMREEIVGFSNQYFYDNRLKTAVNFEASQDFQQLAFEFIDTAGTGYNEEEPENGSGYFNDGEIGLIEKIIEQNPDLNTKDIALISPYRLQVEKIQNRFKDIDVNTIDSFQGQERKVVIISLVRSNENGEIGFLKDYRRMNVAMTRAQIKLIVIGDSATIGNDQFYAKMLEYVESIGGYRSGFELIY
jgi:superfamily I DNA and/or RNA helicase